MAPVVKPASDPLGDHPLGCSSVHPLSTGRPLNPDLFRLEFADGRAPVAWKTFRHKPAFVGGAVGHLVTRREFKALRRLRGIEGVCPLAKDDCRDGLFLEWVPGKPLSEFAAGELPPATYAALEQAVRRMHAARVVHLDLGHRGNILVTPDHKPILLDFQAAMDVRFLPRPLARAFETVDELAILKWKQKQFPRLMTPEEEARVARRRKMTRLWPFHHWFFWFLGRRRRPGGDEEE